MSSSSIKGSSCFRPSNSGQIVHSLIVPWCWWDKRRIIHSLKVCSWSCGYKRRIRPELAVLKITSNFIQHSLLLSEGIMSVLIRHWVMGEWWRDRKLRGALLKRCVCCCCCWTTVRKSEFSFSALNRAPKLEWWLREADVLYKYI